MEMKRVTALLERLPAAIGVPGCQCVVLVGGKVVYTHAAGVRDPATGERVRSDDLYYLYSASKLATCVAALQRLEAGDFLLTDPVGEYLPAFREMTVRVKDADGEHYRRAEKPVTIRDLFSMTAGLDYDLETPAIRAAVENTGGQAPTLAVAEAIAKTPLSFEPGEHWQYSLCHDVLAALVETVSGERFADYVRAHVFEPCGMTDSYYHLTPALRARLAPQFSRDDATGTVAPCGQENRYILGPAYDSGGAGVISTLGDYVRFADALCHRGKTALGERILAPATVELMRTNVLNATCLGEYWLQVLGYGYGLGVRTMISPTLGGSLSPVGEFGWDGAAGAYVMLDPEHELTVFYLQHMLNPHADYSHPRLRNAVYADLGL